MSDKPVTAKERLAIISREMEQDSLRMSAEALLLARRSARLDNLSRVCSESEACRLLAQLAAAGLLGPSGDNAAVNTTSKGKVSN